MSKPKSGAESAAVWANRSQLMQWADNPRKNDGEPVAAVAESIKRFGWGAPIVARAGGEIVAGHTRWKASEALANTYRDASDRERSTWHPDAVRTATTGDVPVRFGDWSDHDAHLLALADNRLNEKAEWDMPKLQEVMSSYGLGDVALAGWDGGDLESMAADIAGGDESVADVVEDEVPEPPKTPVTKPGDLWVLGDHRLLCGDSAHVEPRGDALFYDPPWDNYVPIKNRFLSTLAFGDCSTVGEITDLYGPPTWLFVWDCITSWYVPNRPLRRGKICAWYGNVSEYNWEGAFYGDDGGGHARTVTNTRGSYVHTPDPRGKRLSDVFSRPITAEHSGGSHSHSKPLDWVMMLIANCTAGPVYDPFCGSGTSLIACEQIGRECVAVEISPAYCDVIVERWEQLTGGKAERKAT